MSLHKKHGSSLQLNHFYLKKTRAKFIIDVLKIFFSRVLESFLLWTGNTTIPASKRMTFSCIPRLKKNMYDFKYVLSRGAYRLTVSPQLDQLQVFSLVEMYNNKYILNLINHYNQYFPFQTVINMI